MCESVETCLKMCGLEAFGDAAIGTLGIEHRKRTTIAVELAAKVCTAILWSVDSSEVFPCLA
jgi:hypothetical protein